MNKTNTFFSIVLTIVTITNIVITWKNINYSQGVQEGIQTNRIEGLEKNFSRLETRFNSHMDSFANMKKAVRGLVADSNLPTSYKNKFNRLISTDTPSK